MAPPEVGRPLPRAADAWVSDRKWAGWVLHGDGHGRDWRRAVGEEALDDLWSLIVAELVSAVVTEVRDLGSLGISCRVPMSLPIGGRLLSARTAWHYAEDNAAPRLVTAFPQT